MIEPMPRIPTDADAALTEATERLYRTLAAHPLRPVIAACPHCVESGTIPTADREAMRQAALRSLDADHLRRYTTSALTTWGDDVDFRHFLPRLLELAAAEAFDDFVRWVLLSKLTYAVWRTWPEPERRAIEAFLFAVWERVLAAPPDDAPCGPPHAGLWLVAIAEAERDLTPYIDALLKLDRPHALRHLANIVADDGEAMRIPQVRARLRDERIAILLEQAAPTRTASPRSSRPPPLCGAESGRRSCRSMTISAASARSTRTCRPATPARSAAVNTTTPSSSTATSSSASPTSPRASRR